jgi:hypothetical protein
VALRSTSAVAAKVFNWSAIVSGLLAIVLIFVAQYGAWHVERAAREEELAKNALPEITGEIRTALARPYTSATNEDLATHSISLFLFVCNHRPVDTNIAGVKLNGVDLHPPYFFFDISVSSLKGMKVLGPTEILLQRGILIELIVNASIHMSDASDVPIDFSALTVSLVDGLGGTHVIQAKKGLELVVLG